MALIPGARLGHYEILSPLGAGGMGEVYKARDMDLERAVAMKILPEAFVSDPERVARFQREAKTLASLNHPNISRLTTDPALDTHPLWTPDGQRIVFTSTRAGYPELFWRPADSTGSDERLLTRAKDLLDLLADGWSPDGRQLLFSEVPQSIQCAIGQTTVERPSDVKLLVKNEATNCGAAVSPDGRWMAYGSNISGRYQIYIERYPELGNRQLISTGGGVLPVWSRDGRELFFMTPDGRQMLGVTVQPGTTLVAGRPQVLFEFGMLQWEGGNRPYDIAPDGRFLIIRSGQADTGGAPAANLILVLNWFEALKRLVPVN